jgi:hypothetical protein
MTQKEHLWRYLDEDNEQFYKICLRVARSKPHLPAEAVELEANRIILGSKPESS